MAEDINVGAITEALNNKADVGLGNTALAALKNVNGSLTWNDINMTAMGMPSGVYKDLTLGSSGAEYTAPADGWFYLNKTAGTANAYITIEHTVTSMGTTLHVPGGGNANRGFIPVKAGDVIKITYNATGSTIHFRFIYAEGAKHLAS